MNLTNSVHELIRSRSSRRRYEARAIDPLARRELEAYLEGQPGGPFGSPTRLRLVAATEGDRDALKGLGTYGFIKNAPGFIVGAVRRGDHDMEDYGFAMERAILKATDLGLGTCWLGGTFTRSEFARKIEADDDETVPAVTAIGHATDRRGAMEKVIRWGAGSKKRLPWEALFFSGDLDTPLSAEAAGAWAEPLEMVRLAPSASNKQPWRVVKARGGEGTTLHFFLQRTPGYGRSLGPISLDDLQRVDMGIALCHLELSAGEAGLEGEWVDAPPEISLPSPRPEYITSWKAP